MNTHSVKITEQINNWFYTKADTYAPAHTVCDITGLFTELIENKGFRLCMSFKDFRERICEATCTMYKADMESTEIRGPTKIPNAPRNWGKDIELIWDDYIHTFLLTDDFWYTLWHEVYISVWESQFPNYRIYIQSILPFYIQRDCKLLEENNLVIQKDDGEYVDINDYEDEQEYKSDYD